MHDCSIVTYCNELLFWNGMERIDKLANMKCRTCVKERKGKRVIIDNRRFILYKRSSFKYIYIYIFLCWFLNVILYNGENEKRRYKEKPYKWVEQVKIRKRRFLARSIDSVIHGTEMELGVQLNMFLSLKSLPLLFRFYYFVFFFFLSLVFFPYPANS